MTREEIDTMWQQALRNSIEDGEMFTRYHFAKLVAAHTLANIDPSSFMSYQEGFEAGNKLAIDGIIKQLRQLHDSYSCASNPSTIKAKGKA